MGTTDGNEAMMADMEMEVGGLYEQKREVVRAQRTASSRERRRGGAASRDLVIKVIVKSFFLILRKKIQISELNSKIDNKVPFPPRHIRMVSHDGVVEDEVESETKQSQQEKKRKEKPGGDNDDQFN